MGTNHKVARRHSALRGPVAAAVVAIAALASACSGEVEGAAMPADDAPINGRGPDGECISTASPGAPVPLKRLTASQVKRTAAEVLGADAALFVSDERLATAYRSNVSSSVDQNSARAYLDFAEATVAGADLSPCTADACEAWLLEDIAPRLFRRPLDADELTRYRALYDAGVDEDGAQEGARWVLEALLTSPSFLYLDEVTGEDGATLTGLGVAARLALSIWGANPDEDLLTRAAAGELDTPEAVVAEAERMLADPRAEDGLREFVDQWFHLEKLDEPDSRPDIAALGAGTVAALREEPVAFTRGILENGGGLAELLTATDTAALEPLRGLYGSDIASEANGVFSLNPDRRAGVLTVPGVMAALAHAEITSPTMRGHTILGNVLCTPPSPPPAGLDVTVPPVVPGKTTRERLETHFSDPSCSSCHRTMDGIGFAFEGFDWLGRTRTEDNGLPVDDNSEFILGDDEITVDGAVDLANVLSDRSEIAACVAKQWIRYSTGIAETQEAGCLVEQMGEDLLGEDGLRRMMLTYVSSDWFRRGSGDTP